MDNTVGIRLAGCGKTFADGTRALERVDLDINPGETVVLLGPSGCGKTTMLRIIAGLEQPDAGGRVLFGGEDVTLLPIEHPTYGPIAVAVIRDASEAFTELRDLRNRLAEAEARAGTPPPATS